MFKYAIGSGHRNCWKKEQLMILKRGEKSKQKLMDIIKIQWFCKKCKHFVAIVTMHYAQRTDIDSEHVDDIGTIPSFDPQSQEFEVNYML